ncbi:MAG: hypothetical protein ACXVIJ_11835 [Thermoanaerobaculia bacterium]
MLERNGELHRFLHREIGSDEALSILLLLASNPSGAWRVDDIRDQLGIQEDATVTSAAVMTKRLELRLEALIEKRLVQRDHRNLTYRYSPDLPASGALVQQLLKLSAAERQDAGRLIYIAPRSGALAFADAFSGKTQA